MDRVGEQSGSTCALTVWTHGKKEEQHMAWRMMMMQVGGENKMISDEVGWMVTMDSRVMMVRDAEQRQKDESK